MTADITTAILALAGLAGFILEWRRESNLGARVEQLEGQVAELQAWRDRTARAQ